MANETVIIQLKGEDKFSQVYATFASSSQQIEKQVKNLTQALMLEGKAAGKTSDEIELLKLSMMGASQEQLNAVKSAQLFRNEQVSTAKSSGALNQQFRFMRGGLGQVGHQIQDVAVQLQMGQNALLVFGQQGSQVASLFGPHGAMLGAFLAVGAAVATAFIPSMKKSKDAVKSLSDQIKESNKDLSKATAEQRRYLMGQEALKRSDLNKQLVKDREALADIFKNYISAQKAVKDFANGNAGAGAEAYRLAEAQEGANETIRMFSSDVVEAKARIDTTTQALNQSRQAFEDIKDPAAAASREYQILLDAMGEELKAAKKGADALFILQQKREGATDAQAQDALKLQRNLKVVEERAESERQRLNDSAAAAKKAADASVSFSESLSAQISELTLTGDELYRFKALQAGASQETLDAAVASMKRIDSLTAEALATKNAADQLEALSGEVLQLTLTGDALYQYQAIMAGATEETLAQVVALMKQRDALLAQKLASEEATKADEKRRAEMEKYMWTIPTMEQSLQSLTANGMDKFTESFSAAISGAQSFSDAMKSMVKSVIDDLIKLMVQYYITQQIFGAITNGVTRGQISAQSGYGFDMSDPFEPSYAGGGFTGMGSRSGGVDGKGGFRAVLHPNETVIDHTKGQSMGGVVVNQTINVSTGVQQTVRAEIATLMPQIANAAKSAVADARMRGGSYSKSLVGA